MGIRITGVVSFKGVAKNQHKTDDVYVEKLFPDPGITKEEANRRIDEKKESIAKKLIEEASTKDSINYQFDHEKTKVYWNFWNSKNCVGYWNFDGEGKDLSATQNNVPAAQR